MVPEADELSVEARLDDPGVAAGRYQFEIREFGDTSMIYAVHHGCTASCMVSKMPEC